MCARIASLVAILLTLTLPAEAAVGPPTSAHPIHAPHACMFRSTMIHTAFHGGMQDDFSANLPSDSTSRRCADGASRIGAGYTRLLSTQALRHPKPHLHT